MHLGPWVGLKTLELSGVRLHHPFEDRRVGRGSLAYPLPPSRDVGSPIPDRGQPKQFQPQDVWDDRDGGERIGIAGQLQAPLARAKVRLFNKLIDECVHNSCSVYARGRPAWPKPG